MSTLELSDGQPFPSVINVHGHGEVRRYTPERTCEMEFIWSDPEDLNLYKCGKCHGLVNHLQKPEYCSNCGAKVIKYI